MKKNLFFVGALMMASLSMMAQTKNGGINQTMLQQIEKSQTGGVTNKALFNAIAGNNIDDLVKNHANEAPVDTHFSIETPSQSFIIRRVRAVAGCLAASMCSVPTLLSTTSR